MDNDRNKKDYWLPKEFTEKTVTKAIEDNVKRKQGRINEVVIVNGTPLFSWVELNINELCNRSCVFCPRNEGYPNTNVHMEVSLAEIIATQLDNLKFKGIVNISGTGEPLLTKHIADIVKPFGDRNIQIEITTNGDKLKPELIEDLYRAGLTQLVISMYDGPEQIDHFTNLFKDLGIRRDLYTLRDRWYDEQDDYGLMYTNRAGSLGSNFPTPKRGACYYPHYTIFIDWDGEILLCCHDMYNKTETFGNVNDLPLLELWKNQRLTHFRKKLKNGDRSESPCNNCSANGVVLGKFHAEKW
jgi:radical SAM protein with 4Fe4S-binding SPASM domain|tara:strand:+ start:14039 stop:14935 length:897 start_codon:yes stop_codon:yes gene_type:complete